MDFKRGFFRLWVAASLLWVPSVIVANWADIQQDTAWSPQSRREDNPFTRLPVPCSEARGTKGQHYAAGDASEPWNRYRSIPGACWYSQKVLRELYPEYAELDFKTLEDRLYRRLDWQKAEERDPLTNTKEAAIGALLPPIGILLIVYLGTWVFAGFRRPTTS